MAPVLKKIKILGAPFLFLGVLSAPLLTSPAEAACAAYPQVPWWGKLSHKGVSGYVSHKHGGNWSGYLDKWQRQHAKVKAVHAKGHGIKIKSTGLVLKDAQLNAYIAQLGQRVEINQCLAQEKSSKKNTATRTRTRTKLRINASTPYGDGLNAYKIGDYKTAHAVWLWNARGGDVKSQNAMGHLYRKGLGVEADIAKARQWYARSASAGNPVGRFSLGRLDMQTALTSEEMTKAIEQIERAAMLDYPRAQFALAEIYHKGEAVRADKASAYFWAALAVKNKYAKAKPLLEKIDQSLPEAVRQTQSARVENWFSRMGS